MRTVGISLLILVMALALQAERQPFSRYQPIIDRQMFGALPADFDPEKMPSEVSKSGSKGEAELTKEQEQIKSAIRFSSINITPTGETAVGFTDNSDPKVPRHYYLKVGEKRNGWEVKEADAVKATMTIAKGDVTVSLALGGDSSKTAGATAKNSETAASSKPSGSGLLQTGSSGGSLMERLRNKRSRQMEGMFKKLQAENAERERARAEESAKREEERQMIQDELQAVREQLRQKTADEKTKAEAATSEAPAAHEGEG